MSFILEEKLLEAYWLLDRHLTELNKAIDTLPRGAVISKKIHGRFYYYHQWTEDGKTKDEYLKQGAYDHTVYHTELKIKLRKEYLKYRKDIIADMKSIEKLLGGENVKKRADTFHRRREIKETKEGYGYCEWKLLQLPQELVFENNMSLEEILF